MKVLICLITMSFVSNLAFAQTLKFKTITKQQYMIANPVINNLTMDEGDPQGTRGGGGSALFGATSRIREISESKARWEVALQSRDWIGLAKVGEVPFIEQMLQKDPLRALQGAKIQLSEKCSDGSKSSQDREQIIFADDLSIVCLPYSQVSKIDEVWQAVLEKIIGREYTSFILESSKTMPTDYFARRVEFQFNLAAPINPESGMIKTCSTYDSFGNLFKHDFPAQLRKEVRRSARGKIIVKLLGSKETNYRDVYEVCE